MEDVQVQTITNEREHPSVRTKCLQPLEEHELPEWLNCRPHTLLILFFSLGSICLWSLFFDDSNTRGGIFTGVFASVIMFLAYAVVHFHDSLLIRPHPAFWRIIKGASVLYLLLLIFLLFQTVDNVRAALGTIDPALGKPLPEKNYAVDCRIYTPELPNIFNNLYESIDLFISAHFFGWFIKALIIRDWRLLWICSLLFEVMEVSLRHMLPNFWECWWDHLILDVFGCNLLGMLAGMSLCKYFKMKRYNWRTVAPSGTQFFTSRFIPQSWTTYDYPPFLNDLRTFVCLTVFIFYVTLLDLNLFFLKFELWLPTSHWILVIRTVLFVGCAASGSRDFYEYLTDESRSRLGEQCWLNIATLTTELVLVIKFGRGLFHEPMPTWIKISWSIVGTLFVLMLIRLAFKDRQKAKQA